MHCDIGCRKIRVKIHIFGINGKRILKLKTNIELTTLFTPFTFGETVRATFASYSITQYHI